MTTELSALLPATASIAFLHTLLGPDHYLPFIAMSKSYRWSLRKTTLVTCLCGIGHVVSSMVLGLPGVGLGLGITRLEALQSFRGDVAAWALIAFGLMYCAWGIRKSISDRPHVHLHGHRNGLIHGHKHTHQRKHVHAHVEDKQQNMTPWILFTIFIFGPCEPLLPLLIYPAANSNLGNLIPVTCVFAATTIATMLTIVLLSTLGIKLTPVSKLGRYSHALSGATILICGVSIQFFNL